MSSSLSATTRSSSGTHRESPDDSRSGLLLVAGEGILETFPLAAGEAVIGRAPECDVAIAHATLSRRHARLRVDSPVTVEDLGSKNGVVVADRRIEPGTVVPLAVGEGFQIGRFSFVVVRLPRSGHASTHHSLTDGLRVVDPTAEHVSALVHDLARSEMNVLILGETGVGKEILAETIHGLSGRTGSFVRINCAAIAPALIESELFGHVKGAFTGATQERPGLIESAARGTVFLDEVGELPEAVQAKLLRVIELREVLRVGGVRPSIVDVRFVAATNRDLTSDVASGRFRSDLFYRLDGITLVIPPLRERRERIEPLGMQFLQAALDKRPPAGPLRLEHGLFARLVAHDWPGNVRELKAVIERAVLLAGGGEIGARHIALTPPAKAAGPRPPANAPVEPAPAPAPTNPPPGLSPAEAEERQRILDALAACTGNQTRAAKQLGISRTTLVNKLGLYRIPRPRK